ncbi:hypothetical protein ACF6ZU_23300 [Pseudomonas migulae]|uniref:hypothetical protein n=1 Tax=Pseudomonas migulae TaxID=78543 RepID=UPI003718C5AA
MFIYLSAGFDHRAAPFVAPFTLSHSAMASRLDAQEVAQSVIGFVPSSVLNTPFIRGLNPVRKKLRSTAQLLAHIPR